MPNFTLNRRCGKSILGHHNVFGLTPKVLHTWPNFFFAVFSSTVERMLDSSSRWSRIFFIFLIFNQLFLPFASMRYASLSSVSYAITWCPCRSTACCISTAMSAWFHMCSRTLCCWLPIHMIQLFCTRFQRLTKPCNSSQHLPWTVSASHNCYLPYSLWHKD